MAIASVDTNHGDLTRAAWDSESVAGRRPTSCPVRSWSASDAGAAPTSFELRDMRTITSSILESELLAL
jgi:hypothetical protein